MLLESIQKKEDQIKAVTDEEILAEVSVPISQKVTPYAHLDYSE